VKNVALVALAAAACSSPLPVIETFTVDNANPEAGAPVTFSFSVSGATRGIGIYPTPGPVDHSPVTVIPAGSAIFTLRAANENGESTRDLSVTVRSRPPLAINTADALPGQVLPGAPVTLSWTTTSAESATMTEGSTGQPSSVAVNGSLVVNPALTTVYTLTANNKPGLSPASVTAKITARVASPPSVTGFTANPNPVTQGQPTTLSWIGNASSYSVTDGTTTFNVGPRRSVVVRPQADTTYTLNATGPGGVPPIPPRILVKVNSQPTTTALVYTAPGGGPLQLVFHGCNSPCTALTLKIVATSAVQLRGIALDLPLDTTKVSFDAASFGLGPALPGAVPKAALGSGPLQDTLALGIALKGTGTAPAQDVTVAAGAELARFTLVLVPTGGPGTVFSGATPAASPYKAMIQSASGRAANAIAVGKLDAQ